MLLFYLAQYPKFKYANKHDFNMLFEEIENKITIKTIAIVVTHIFGYPSNVKKIEALIKKKELF